MANQEHLDILKQGVEFWNRWRQESLATQLDLSGVDLSFDSFRRGSKRASFRNADFSGVDLNRADLRSVDLRGANLRYANLCDATLKLADLSGADLRKANLSYADLSHTNFSHTDLRGADLRHTNFNRASLNHANLCDTNLIGAGFDSVTVGGTTFGNVDLSVVKGLETARHRAPSTIGFDTIIRSQGDIPKVFLRGAGLPESLIDRAHSLVGKPTDYYKCFISYSSKDQKFAERLYTDLKNKGVCCWLASHDLQPGTYLHRGITDAIHLHEKTLLLLSEHAIQSGWVEREVETTLNREAKEKRQLLFPIRLDYAVFQTQETWVARLRDARHIGDFTHWQDDTVYQQRLADLLRHLKVKPQP